MTLSAFIAALKSLKNQPSSSKEDEISLQEIIGILERMQANIQRNNLPEKDDNILALYGIAIFTLLYKLIQENPKNGAYLSFLRDLNLTKPLHLPFFIAKPFFGLSSPQEKPEPHPKRGS